MNFKLKTTNSLPLFCAMIFLAAACGDEPMVMDPESNNSERPNILLIIADDMGKDATNGFDEGVLKPSTPNIDKIANEGLKFSNFWVNPTCSPTRASIITGKYGYRTNVKWASDQLSQSEQVLQSYIAQETNNTYASALIGKWHLSGSDSSVNPEDFGVGHYAGLIRGSVQDYYNWQFTEDGGSSINTNYITEVFSDLSIDWIKQQNKPWFLWLAYNAPHTPFHVPPQEMHRQGDLVDYEDGMDATPYYMAAIEAMDYQIGRVLNSLADSILENTIIIFIGDNGTPIQVVQTPYSSSMAKGSIYQGGVNVPLFVSGKGVSKRGEDISLITSTDIFATIAQLAGSKVSAVHDSKSFVDLFSSTGSVRDFQYTEMNNGSNDLWAIGNGRYKLIINANGDEEMYDLFRDPYEQDNLIELGLSSDEGIFKSQLEEELLNIRN